MSDYQGSTFACTYPEKLVTYRLIMLSLWCCIIIKISVQKIEHSSLSLDNVQISLDWHI